MKDLSALVYDAAFRSTAGWAVHTEIPNLAARRICLQHQTLGADGTYDSPDNVTYFNRIVSGQTTPITGCF